MYIISSCLLGTNCKYNGGNNYNEEVIQFCQEHSFFPICPEIIGGLSTPRTPAERVGDLVLNKDGQNVTEVFRQGATATLQACITEAEKRGEPLEGAILKANSPSCGFGQIYDGSFSGVLIKGNGIFAEVLYHSGIKVITEKEKIEW